MIIEQAFYSLPEFLVGTGFVKYESEGTLVMAFAMAMLQELNGRNVNNPIALIRGEVSYMDTNNRTADIHFDYSNLNLLSTALGMYGIRLDNWLEAKFFRKNHANSPTLDTTTGAYAILRDLLRLAVFPTEVELQCKKSRIARYFLHVYEGKVEDHIALQRNSGKGKRVDRNWLSRLYTPGSHSFEADDFGKEPSTFDAEIGKELRNIKFSGTTTTYAIAPKGAAYLLYLTRLDKFTLERDNKKITLDHQSCNESSPGVWLGFRRELDGQLAT